MSISHVLDSGTHVDKIKSWQLYPKNLSLEGKSTINKLDVVSIVRELSKTCLKHRKKGGQLWGSWGSISKGMCELILNSLSGGELERSSSIKNVHGVRPEEQVLFQEHISLLLYKPWGREEQTPTGTAEARHNSRIPQQTPQEEKEGA